MEVCRNSLQPKHKGRPEPPFAVVSKSCHLLHVGALHAALTHRFGEDVESEALQRAVKSLDIKADYATQFQRTWLTPDAGLKARALTPIKLPPDNMAAVAERMKAEHPNDVVLAVGHSNTTPKLLKALGVTESIEIAHDEYDNLFIVIPSSTGPATLLRLRY